MRVEMRRAIARSCVEISIERPSARSSARIDTITSCVVASTPFSGSSSSSSAPLREQRARQQHALALAAGELADLRVGAIGEADARELIERLARAARARAAGTTAGAGSRRSARRRAPSRG